MRFCWRLVTPLVATLALACAATPEDAGPGDETDPLVDSTPPVLEVTTPARGAILAGATSVELRGRVTDSGVGVESLKVNGNLVTVGADGRFTTQVKLDPGITLIQTKVLDREKNEKSETRAVLSGDLVPVDTVVPEGLTFRLDRQLLRVAGEVGARTVAGLDLEAKVKEENPIFDGGFTCLSARVDVSRLRKGAVHFVMEPVAGGLSIDASVSDLEVALHVSYDFGCEPRQGELVLRARSFRLEGTVELGLDAQGNVWLDASGATAAFEGFDWGGDVFPETVRDFLEQPLADAMAVLVAEQLEQQLSEQVAERLRGQDQPVRFGEEELFVALRPTMLRADASGILVTMDTRVRVLAPGGTVFARTPATRPALERTPRGLAIGISDDALNELLASLWGAGALTRDLVVPPEELEQLGLGFNHMELSLGLPPVVEALPDGGGLRVTIADMVCVFEQRAPGKPPVPAGSVAVALRGVFTASVADHKLALTTTKPEIFIDVLTSEGPKELNEDALRALASILTGSIVHALGDAVSGVPLPAAEGLRVIDGTVTTGDTAGGYVVVRGDVAAR